MKGSIESDGDVEYVIINLESTDDINKQRVKTLARRVSGSYLEVLVLATEESVVMAFRSDGLTAALRSELERVLPESAQVTAAELDLTTRLEGTDVGVEFHGVASRRLDSYTPLQPAVENGSPLQPVPVAISDLVATAAQIDGDVLVQLLIEPRDDEDSLETLEEYLTENMATAKQLLKSVWTASTNGDGGHKKDALAAGNERRLNLLEPITETYTVNVRATVSGTWATDKAQTLAGALSAANGPFYGIEGELINDDLDRLREAIRTRKRYTTAAKSRFYGGHRRRAIVAQVDALPHFLIPETEHMTNRSVKQLDTPEDSPPTPPTLRDLHGMR